MELQYVRFARQQIWERRLELLDVLVFEQVADDLDGDIVTQTLSTETPESHLNTVLTAVGERFNVRVGCYPIHERKRIRLVSETETELYEAVEWLADQPEIDSAPGGDEGAE